MCTARKHFLPENRFPALRKTPSSLEASIRRNLPNRQIHPKKIRKFSREKAVIAGMPSFRYLSLYRANEGCGTSFGLSPCSGFGVSFLGSLEEGR